MTKFIVTVLLSFGLTSCISIPRPSIIAQRKACAEAKEQGWREGGCWQPKVIIVSSVQAPVDPCVRVTEVKITRYWWWQKAQPMVYFEPVGRCTLPKMSDICM